MQDLPYAKREPRIRAQTAVTGMRGPFDPAIEQSVPQNQQMISTRRFQYGVNPSPRLKTNAQVYLDSRIDQLTRNRDNMFSDSTRPIVDLPRLPKTPTATTRHMHTPYSYNTTWIDHPDENTSLAPKKPEMFKTSFLNTPVADQDRIDRAKKTEMTYRWKNTREEQLQNYKDFCDMRINQRYTNTLERMRHDREDYNKALEIRRKREHIHYFE